MADKIRFELNRDAVSELLKNVVQGELLARGRSIAAAAGPGHEVELFVGRTRARVTVRTDTFAARLAESRDRNLTRALDAGR
jgi:hypothetical protein